MRTLTNQTSLNQATFDRGLAVVCLKDPDLARAVSRWGKPPFWCHAPGFAGLVMAILAQQVSLESAQAAFSKLEKAIDAIDPEGFLELKDDALRRIGFSRQKASYVRGIAGGIATGVYDLTSLASMDNAAARECLMEMKGIGPWTADTYLLFSLRRPDAWPSGDLALIKAIQELRDLASTPSVSEADRIAERWKPWRAVAARILWHHYLCGRGRGTPASS